MSLPLRLWFFLCVGGAPWLGFFLLLAQGKPRPEAAFVSGMLTLILWPVAMAMVALLWPSRATGSAS